MEETLIIIQYPTFSAIHISNKQPYSNFVRDFVQKKLTDYNYDNRFKRYRPNRQYYYYDEINKCLCIPVEFTSMLVALLKSRNIRVKLTKNKTHPGDPINLMMNPSWHDRPKQTPAIKFLTKQKCSMRGLALSTGLGKTYCAIKTIVKLNRVTIVLTAGLVEQWMLAIQEQTNIKEEDLYVLKGYNSILDIMDSDLRPKIFIGSIATIRGFIKNNDNYNDAPMNYTEFLKHFGVGIKIVDECHENFHAITQIDLRSIVRNNIYLSATYTRTNKSTLSIFNRIFPPTMRYGEGSYKKYVDITFYRYNLAINERKVMGVHGYSHPKYEKLIIHNKDFLDMFVDQVLIPCIDAHYINIKSEGQKLLILVSTVDLVTLLVDTLSEHYNQLTIKPYTAADPDDNYKEGTDIIVSTPTSSGTGVDIKELRTAINTVSIQAEARIKQMLGRLRELPSGDIPEYVDIFNNNITAQRRHAKRRTAIYKQMGKKFKMYRLH